MPKLDSETVRAVAEKHIAFRKDFQARTGAPQLGEVQEFLRRGVGIAREFCEVIDVKDPEILTAIAEMCLTWAAETRKPGFIA